MIANFFYVYAISIIYIPVTIARHQLEYCKTVVADIVK